MRLALVLPSMSCGGAQRVMSIMSNYWVKGGNDIMLITIDSEENDFYSLDHRVRRVGFDLLRGSTSLWAAIKNNIIRIACLRKTIKMYKPDAVISFIDHTNVMTILAAFGLHVAVVVSERNDPRQYSIGIIKDFLRRWIYPRADALVVQTTELSKWAEKIVHYERVHVIPNPLLLLPETDISSEYLKIESPFIVAMGRLVTQKGFDMLLEAFAQCSNDHKEWSLVILGEGPQRNDLKDLSRKLGIESHVYFPGRIHSPHTVLQQAEIFVLSSRYEGFPNALLEAMSCGLPVVSFNCPTGPGDIISDGQNGLLIPTGNVMALAEAMNDLINDDIKRKRIGDGASLVAERFSVDKVMRVWDDMLSKVM